ncbi:MAG: hypothetical protein ACTTIX_03440 [Peptoanaerobacter stomatis]
MRLIDKIKEIEKYICENFEEWDLDDPVEEEYFEEYREISGVFEEDILSFEEKFNIILSDDVKALYRLSS